MIREYYKITKFENLDKMIHSRIKTKNQIISILVTSLKIILTDLNPSENGVGTFCIKDYGLKRRIFFTVYDEEKIVSKHFSFAFPFNMTFSNAGVYFGLNNREIQIDLFTLEILSTLVKNNWFADSNEENHNILTFFESYCDLLDEYNISNEIEVDLWSVIKALLTFEPGYVRYDYDEENVEEHVHPLHHIDVYYSDIGTFKLGFNENITISNRLNLEEFEDILLDGKSRKSHCYKLS